MSRPDRQAEEKSRAAPPPRRRGKKAKPAEPGDEVDATSWMGGLSSRLSAYSLSGEEEPGDETDEASTGETDATSRRRRPDRLASGA